jgi:hypothetical protein
MSRTKVNRGKNELKNGVYTEYMSIFSSVLPKVGALGDEE